MKSSRPGWMLHMAEGETFFVDLARVVVDPDLHVLGMDWRHIRRSLRHPDRRPIEVETLNNGFWSLRNGRHRFVSAMIRGEDALMACLWVPAEPDLSGVSF